jgi:precorrin-4 methylase
MVENMTWTLTPEIETQILEHLENGFSLVKICAQEKMPSRSTVLRWQRENPDFDAKCVRAREAQGEFAAEKLDDINDKVERGELEPAAASIISSNLKWKASKLYCKKYGDKTLHANPDGETPVTFTLAIGGADAKGS